MTEASPTRIVNKVVIRGRIEDIWRELTKNDEPQAAIFNAWLHAQRLAPGAKLQMRTGDGKFTLVIGEVREFDPRIGSRIRSDLRNTTIRNAS